MDVEPTVSVVIVNYNGLGFIHETLDSILCQTRAPEEIIVVDNASSDGSATEIAARYPGVQLVRSSENRGFAGGVNLGLMNARGSVLALINSDAKADSRWLEALLKALTEYPEAAVAEGKILPDDGSAEIEQAGALFNNLGNYWGRGFRDRDEGQFDDPAEVPGVTACAMIVRREALRGGPLFDDRLFMYGEELELTLRLRIEGWSIRYVPAAVVRHGGMRSIKASTASPWLFQKFHTNRNRIGIVARYFPAGLIIRNLPLLVLGLVYADIVFLTKGGIGLFLRAIGSQTVSFFRGIRHRSPTVMRDAMAWLPWMTTHDLRGILRQKKRM